jgi:hypothetical protein
METQVEKNDFDSNKNTVTSRADGIVGSTGLLRSQALSTDGRLQRSDPIEL